MSTTEHQITEQHLTVAQLAELLSQCKTFVRPAGVSTALEATNTKVASEDEWNRFFSTINTIADVPVTMLLEATERGTSDENDDIKASGKIGIVLDAIQTAIEIAGHLWDFFSGFDDKEGRSKWTQQLVKDAYNNDPTFNYVVVYTSHSINFDGKEDEDWSRRNYSYKLKIGSLTYTLYAVRSGVFSLRGDGGFLNWAYIGRVVSADPDSKRPRNVVFRA